MATATPDRSNLKGGQKFFSEQELQRLIAEDNSAFSAVAILLSAVITLGLLAMLGTLVAVF